WWSATPRAITQARDALGVEADHPVPERLPVHPRLLGGPLAAHAVERIGQTQQPADNPPIPFKPGQAPQLRSRAVAPDRQRCTHSCPPSSPTPRKGNHILA